MKNKTAMQEMLEWTRKTFPMDLDTPRMIEAKIESLLKAEKEYMIGFSIKVLDNTYCSYDGEHILEKPIKDIYDEVFEK
jgi:hypothetical protein